MSGLLNRETTLSNRMKRFDLTKDSTPSTDITTALDFETKYIHSEIIKKAATDLNFVFSNSYARYTVGYVADNSLYS